MAATVDFCFACNVMYVVIILDYCILALALSERKRTDGIALKKYNCIYKH